MISRSELIFVVVLLLMNSMVMAQEKRQLFNGKDLDGWDMIGPGAFVIENGLLKTTGGMGLLLFKGEKFANVKIHVEYTFNDSNANSGVFIRIPEYPEDPWKAVHGGYEVQIFGESKPSLEYHSTGCLYSLTRAQSFPQKKPGEWNNMDIVLDGIRTIVYVNDQKVTDYTEGDAVPPKKNWYEPERGRRPEKGFIGLQNHDDESVVFYREVSVSPLDK